MTDRFTFRVSAGLLLVAAAAGALSAFVQNPFAPSRFEFGQYRAYSGQLELWPNPILLTESGPYLLVAPGKHGLTGLVAGPVRLEGALIERGQDKMLEVPPASIKPSRERERAVAPASLLDLGSHTLTGEIVDSKCFLGVMNPGNGKVHRDCAVRCISGGIPPALLVKDRAGEPRVLLLAGRSGRPIHREVLDYVAEPVSIPGRLLRRGSTLLFEIDPRDIRRE